MAANLKLQTKMIIMLIALYLVFFGWGRYRQVMGSRYYQTGTQALQEGNYPQAVFNLGKALSLSPKSFWVEKARNEMAFARIILGESKAAPPAESTSFLDWFTSSSILSIVAVIIILLFAVSFIHVRRLTQSRKQEEYLNYLRLVEHRIRAKMKPSVEGLNTITFDGVGDYESYINYYQKSEYVALAKCMVAEFRLAARPSEINQIQALERSYLEFTTAFDNSSFFEEVQQKLANLYFFSLGNYEAARLAYKLLQDKFPQSKWIKIAQARVKLIEENPDDNYEPLRYYIKAERYYEEKKYNESLEQFGKLIATFPQSKLAVESQYNMSDIYFFKTNQVDHAIAEYQKLIDQYGQSSFAGKSQYKIAECYKKLAKYPEAIQAYEKFIANYPQAEFLDYAYNYIGHCCEQLHDVKKAIETYQKIMNDFPGSIWVVVAESRIAALTPK
jgi:tetratricopeptide (TPR) repeat protein